MNPQKILVFQTAFLGDAILCIPLLKNLREQYPSASLGFVCRQGVGPLFSETGLVDQVIEVDKSDSKKLKEAYRLTQEFGADLVVSPHRSFRTALWIWRLHSKMTIGFRDAWSFFAFQRRVKRSDYKHDVVRQASLLEALDFKISEESLNLKIDVPSNEKFSHLTHFVALSPGSQWKTKQWTESGYVKVGQELKKKGYLIVILGTANEKDLGQRISNLIPGSVNLCGQTSVLELAQVLSQAKLLVCNDSGTMHVAASVGTAVVSIFGATVPSQGYAPWIQRSKVIEIDLSCRPCGAHGHNACPLGHHHCMTEITPGKVIQAAEGFLK